MLWHEDFGRFADWPWSTIIFGNLKEMGVVNNPDILQIILLCSFVANILHMRETEVLPDSLSTSVILLLPSHPFHVLLLFSFPFPLPFPLMEPFRSFVPEASPFPSSAFWSLLTPGGLHESAFCLSIPGGTTDSFQPVFLPLVQPWGGEPLPPFPLPFANAKELKNNKDKKTTPMRQVVLVCFCIIFSLISATTDMLAPFYQIYLEILVPKDYSNGTRNTTKNQGWLDGNRGKDFWSQTEL